MKVDFFCHLGCNVLHSSQVFSLFSHCYLYSFFFSEEQKRFSIFRKNMKKAYKLQHKEKGTAKYGVNEFADMSRM